MENIRQSDAQSLQELAARVAQLEAMLAEKEKLLLESEKMMLLGKLCAGIAHEINTPLGALKSNYDLFVRCIDKIKHILFQQVAAAPELQQNHPLVNLFDNIDTLNEVNLKASQRIVEIVNSVRRFARQDQSEPVEADLAEIITSTLAIVHHELKNRIAVHQELADLPPLSGFPNQLSQIILNILVNASHAIEDKGEIFIRLYNQGDDAVVEIRDTGKGMPAEKLERIFEPGYTTKSSGKGMGLGLSLVQQMVENHAGRIDVESKENVGTTFRIILPLKRSAPA
ncbi:MAG: GHKL domain-containing protein [Calditrichaeota bacterium]|nr:GHKL domain-containing protein [Calditrichota bacterium]